MVRMGDGGTDDRGEDVAETRCTKAVSIRGGVVGRAASAPWDARGGMFRVRGCGSPVMGSGELNRLLSSAVRL